MLERYQLWLAWILAIGLSVSGSVYITAKSQISIIKPLSNTSEVHDTAQAAVAPESINATASPDSLRFEVPILMYHSISEADNKLCVSPNDFAAQLDYLVQAGYQTITVKQLAAALDGEAVLPRKPIVITLDDGYRDNYTVAYPLLKERGMVATIYMIVKKIGTANSITVDELSEMMSYGIEIGSHTYRHLDLRYLDEDALEKEIVDSQQALSQMLRAPIETFCYPSGRYTPLALEKVKAAPYKGAVTTHPGIMDDPKQRWLMPRIRVHGGESLESFIASLPKNTDDKE